MSAANLIARLQQQRDSWLVLREEADGLPELAVRLRRPAEAELQRLRPQPGQDADAAVTAEVCRAAVDWRGFTEAELLGAAVGSSDPVPFSTELWAEVVRDRLAWLTACASHLTAQVAEHMKAREGARKN